MKYLHIFIALIIPCCHCLFMYIPKNSKKCISQELDNEDAAVVTFGRELSDVSAGSVAVEVSNI